MSNPLILLIVDTNSSAYKAGQIAGRIFLVVFAIVLLRWLWKRFRG